MFCRNCGKELTGAPEVCTNCGAKPMAGTDFCFGCGAPTTPLTEICTNCGARLAEAIKERTWKPTVAGIICIIAGIAGIIVASGLAPPAPPSDPALMMIFFYVPSIILGIVAIAGGIYALIRRVWGLALTGSIALVGFGIVGILSIIFVSLGKREFK